MLRRPVIIITGREERGTYAALPLPEEQMKFCAMEEGIKAVTQYASDLVILDCGPETARGIGILQEIKRLRSDLPVIFLTERGSEEIVIEAFKSGAREYFRKPANMAAVGKIAEDILHLKRGASGKRLSLAAARKECSGEDSPPIPDDIPEKLLRAVRHMKKNLANPLCLEEVAQEACLSKFHFCRLFKKHVGSSPMQFMVNLRIDKAARLLRCSDFKISSVAIQSGFANLSEFNKQFKKATGTTPSTYRKATP